MKTKRFRLLTVLLAAVMMLALSVNVMAAKSNAVTKDGLTAQLITDKDSYKAGESVKASVQVENHTGEKVYVITQMTAPAGVVLENANVAFDAFLEAGESWEAVGGVVTSTGNAVGAAATAGSTTATGDNMQAGFWVLLTALYLHAAVWKLAVDSILQHNEKVEEGLHKILPGHHEYFETCGEPYVMFNSYMGEQTGYRVGKPGQSWRTATGQWLMYAIVRYIYGLQPEFDGLLLQPCLPPAWKECFITKKFRDCQYNIQYIQKGQGARNKITSVLVDGCEVDGSKPIKPQKGKILNIEVILSC